MATNLSAKSREHASRKHKKSYLPSVTPNWVFLDSLTGYNKEFADEAKNLISSTKTKVFESKTKARLNTLKSLMQHERSKERAFFDYFKIPYNPKQDFEYVRAIHKFLQIENVLEANINNLVSGKSYIDVTKKFPNIYEKHLRNFLQSSGVDSLDGQKLWEITMAAVEEMYTADTKTQKNPYKELWAFLKQNEQTDPIIQTILHQFLGVSMQDIENIANFKMSAEAIRKQMKMDNSDQYASLSKKMARPVGYLLEQQTTGLLKKAFHGDKKARVQHSGDFDNMKADTLITYNIKLPDDWYELTETESSTRARNIQRMKQLHEAMEDGKNQFIIQISDKSYSINDNFKGRGGFTAQGKISLNNLEKIFTNMQVKLEGGSMKQLLFALAHIGNNVLTKKEGLISAERYLASKIAYFMFDDIGINEVENSLGANFIDGAIHIFNLNGIYIPLSVYLNALYKALKQLESNDYQDYAKISIEKDSEVFYSHAKDNVLTMQNWKDTKEDRYEQEFLTIHFMANFRNIVSNMIS